MLKPVGYVPVGCRFDMNGFCLLIFGILHTVIELVSKVIFIRIPQTSNNINLIVYNRVVFNLGIIIINNYFDAVNT